MLPCEAPPARLTASARSLPAYCAPAFNSANLFAVSATMSIRRCSLLLQFGDVHLVRDAIGVADALHIAVLNQFFQTPHYGYARQLQRVRDLTCANGREVFNGWLCDKRGLARLSCDERSAPPVEPVVQAHLDDINPLGGSGLYRNNKSWQERCWASSGNAWSLQPWCQNQGNCTRRRRTNAAQTHIPRLRQTSILSEIGSSWRPLCSPASYSHP